MPQMNLVNALLTSNRTITFPDATGTIALVGSPGTVWSLLGNAGTNAATNFVGTTDAVDFVLRANNTERVRVLAAGGMSVVNGPLNLTNSAGTAAELRLFEPSGSGVNFTAFRAQAQAVNLTYALPAAQGAASTFLRNDGSGGLSWATAGGLSFFTEAQSTAAPNATIYANSLRAVAAVADADAVLAPKGTGALLAQVPDNLPTGGNKRGAGAVDWQRTRSNQGFVASGANSVICGGSNNNASGQESTVAGGNQNAATGRAAFCMGQFNTASALGNTSSTAIGRYNTASGADSVAIGFGCLSSAQESSAFGGGCSASGLRSFAAGGGNTASDDYSASFNFSTTADQRYSTAFGVNSRTQYESEIVNGSSSFLNVGDAQSHWITLMRAVTVGAASTDVTIAGGAPTMDNTIVLVNNSAYQFHVRIIARDTAKTGQFAWWNIVGGICRDGGAATTQIIGTTVVETGSVGVDAAGWTAVAQAQTVQGRLQINVSAPAGIGSVRFVATVSLTRVA